jgi:hypothetical protein
MTFVTNLPEELVLVSGQKRQLKKKKKNVEL